MADPFVAEIRIFAFNFAPTGWAFCDGQLLPISQNTALFALLGTNFGGDGLTNFALPDLQARAPLQPGVGQGLSERVLGEEGGVPSVTLLTTEIPQHTHTVQVGGTPGNVHAPSGKTALTRSNGGFAYKDATTGSPNLTPMSPLMIGVTGQSQPHNNLMPYLTMNFCIALQGVFPQRP